MIVAMIYRYYTQHVYDVVVSCVHLNARDHCSEICQSLPRGEKVKVPGILVG